MLLRYFCCKIECYSKYFRMECNMSYTDFSAHISVFFLLLFIVIIYFTATRRESLSLKMDENYFEQMHNISRNNFTYKVPLSFLYIQNYNK